MRKISNQKGFTLIEILVVVALIAILAAITFFAINPGKYFADTRNSQRSSDINAILASISTYIVKDGNTIASMETATGVLATCGDATTPFKNVGTGTGHVNLAAALVDEFMPAIPKDPSGGTDADTGYDICKSANGRITITAPNAENGKTISYTR